MTASEHPDGPYVRAPRRQGQRSGAHDDENIRDELSRILRRAQSVASSPRDDFVDGSASYDVASMVIIRLASLTERPEFAPWADVLSQQEITAIRATRNIAAHAGYAAMNDGLFWSAVTVTVPEIVERLLRR
ncbi:hypothetical protein BJEO58_02523 [Brevibacterium jeotgali]|uniref:Uncharacterized protein n=2 Tax=Brevibacterium jeotgali TaxID=1262550 RepID=A0A2H1L806_9MICO|nr:hypothetical protein FB108_2214 [Brevibacterium jeotgali]SMY12915.1 hypothetical protein BJEO58_02523 [Brevibacterium jeotgali]